MRKAIMGLTLLLSGCATINPPTEYIFKEIDNLVYKISNVQCTPGCVAAKVGSHKFDHSSAVILDIKYCDLGDHYQAQLKEDGVKKPFLKIFDGDVGEKDGKIDRFILDGINYTREPHFWRTYERVYPEKRWQGIQVLYDFSRRVTNGLCK